MAQGTELRAQGSTCPQHPVTSNQQPATMKDPNYNWSYLISICLVSAMGGLLFGYDYVVIGGAKPFYEPFFGITGHAFLQGWAMSCALAGCLAGAVVSGWLSDKLGRKKLLILSAGLFVAASLGTGSAASFSLFVIFRILGGIGIGLASNLSPMYIAEITPASVRGRFVSINQLTIVIGILAAQLINWRIAQPVPPGASTSDILVSWNGQTGWRWMFYACSIPAGLFFILMWFVPESPRWLAKKTEKHQVAKRVLARIGGNEYAATEFAAIEETLVTNDKTSLKFLKQPGIKKLLVLGIVLAIFQQWCGINVIFNYAQEIFTDAGYNVSDILFNIVITGCVNLIFTFVGMFTVDRLGRKALMLLGAGGLAGIYAVLGAMYFFHIQGLPMLIMVVASIACYAMSLAPVTWVVLSEIFPNSVRGTAMSIATFSLWAACFVLTYTFPVLNQLMKASGTFWLYGVICVLGFVFILKKLPETKGKSLEEIEFEMKSN
jgi:MFS transporter, SP family, arabinose:H+ symporter